MKSSNAGKPSLSLPNDRVAELKNPGIEQPLSPNKRRKLQEAFPELGQCQGGAHGGPLHRCKKGWNTGALFPENFWDGRNFSVRFTRKRSNFVTKLTDWVGWSEIS